MNEPLLDLIPFTNHEVGVALNRTLAMLGYAARTFEPTKVQDGAGDDRARAVVVLVGKAETPGLVLSTLDCAAPTPSLALFLAGEAQWDQAILRRCSDCAQWPCGEDELAFRLGRLSLAHGAPPTDPLDPALSETLCDLNLFGRSPAFLDAIRQLRPIARCTAPALIEGETGTGKELIARAIHYLGERANGPFVPINCGALPDHLVENELFGHERGAYTDAKTGALGVIGEAAGGTLFLDEVDALSPKAQACLLRFLQDGEYRQLGGRRASRADTRIIAASNADLHHLCEQRQFRSDLCFRLDVLSVKLPPLRARAGDIALLAANFLDRYCRQYGLPALTLDCRCLSVLQEYPWPGNVRELENLVHRHVLMAEGPSVLLCPGAKRFKPPMIPDGGSSFSETKALAIASFERAYLTRLMDETKGNVSQAARRANKERRAFGRLLKKYGIAPSPFRAS